MQAFCFQTSQNEIVDRIFRPIPIANFGNRRTLGRGPGPVRRPARALIDPLFEQGDLFRLQLFASLGRRHAVLRVGGRDLLDQFAFGGFAGNDGTAAAPQLGEGAFLGIQPQLGLALTGVRTMTRETVFRQERQNLPIEINRGRTFRIRFRLRLSTGNQDQDAENRSQNSQPSAPTGAKPYDHDISFETKSGGMIRNDGRLTTSRDESRGRQFSVGMGAAVCIYYIIRGARNYAI